MLCFWNNGAPRIIKNTSRVELPNGDTRMNAKPDPDLDLFDYVETGAMPGQYEHAGPVTYANDGWTVTCTRSVVPWDAARIRDDMKRKVKIQRDMVRDAGIEWSPDGGVTAYVVQTDSDSRREMTGAVVSINEAGLPDMSWRMMDNSLAAIPAADFKTMALAVSAHVQACYVQQANIEAALDAAADPTIEDITLGWPVHYVAPGVV